VDPIPLHHARKSSPEALVHCAPFVAVLAAVAPVLWCTHAVPLEVYLDAGFLSVRDVASWYRVGGRDGVGGVRRFVDAVGYHGRLWCLSWHRKWCSCFF